MTGGGGAGSQRPSELWVVAARRGVEIDWVRVVIRLPEPWVATPGRGVEVHRVRVAAASGQREREGGERLKMIYAKAKSKAIDE